MHKRRRKERENPSDRKQFESNLIMYNRRVSSIVVLEESPCPK